MAAGANVATSKPESVCFVDKSYPPVASPAPWANGQARGIFARVTTLGGVLGTSCWNRFTRNFHIQRYRPFVKVSNCSFQSGCQRESAGRFCATSSAPQRMRAASRAGDTVLSGQTM